MKKAFYTYTDIESIKIVLCNEPAKEYDASDALDIWRHLFRFLCGQTYFVFNDEMLSIPEDDGSAYYAFVRSIINRHLSGEEIYQLNSGWPEKISTKELLSENNQRKFIIATEKMKSGACAENSGFYFLIPEQILEKWSSLYKITSFIVTKSQNERNRLISWEQLRGILHPLNSIVICDKYVLSSKPGIVYNLFRLLDIILPEKALDAPIDITFFVEQLYFTERDKKADIKEVYELVSDYLTQRIGRGNYNLSLLQPEENLGHLDRFIITNYYVLDAGLGFHFFSKDNKVRLKTFTTLKIVPFTASEQDLETYQGVLNEIARLIRTTPGLKRMGSCKNRLLNS